MPFAIGAPVARMSTMIIDGDLNMGPFSVKTDEISEATPGSKVTLASDIKVPEIREAVLNEGVIIPELTTTVMGLVATPSDRIRYTDSGEVGGLRSEFTLAKEMSVPAAYVDGSEMRIRSTLHGVGYYKAYIQIRVNDVVVSEHSTSEITYQSFYDDITVKGGDKVATWIKGTGTTSADAYTDVLEFRCDDVFINHVKNWGWG